MHKHNKVAFSNFFSRYPCTNCYCNGCPSWSVCCRDVVHDVPEQPKSKRISVPAPLRRSTSELLVFGTHFWINESIFFLIVSFVRSLKWLKIQLKKTKNNCSVLQSFISVMFLEIYERCTNAALGFWGELEKRPFYPRFDSCTTGSLTRCQFKNLLGRLLWILLSWFSLKLTACPSYSLAQVALDL